MSAYAIYLAIVKAIVYLFNGKPQVKGVDNLPRQGEFILAATHRSLLDPIYLAMVLSPREIAFMAKDSLFEIPLLGTALKQAHVFPVNRDKPAPSSIKQAVKVMKEDHRILGIFPSGSRYSSEIKGGTAFIQKLSQQTIVPVAIQPPRNAFEFLMRKKGRLAFGRPIPYIPTATYDKSKLTTIDQAIAQAFSDLDHQLDPEFTISKQKK
ncbi:lysophospholipid acyltransferase family protein [Vaginisenegalia massiliensis]|uniref:lysophospholipid acyltransferase family protein n=1 Tax=Vaginisenegalia massiliensis TaxID=2058294 RepID=UPI000F51E91F|nr:lysophospholipid acyltransferase family protein [Vaginisenegalia massiliensis]